MIEEYIDNLNEAFELQRNDTIAPQQKAYLKDQFEFFGIKTPLRRELQKPFLRKEFLPSKQDAKKIVRTLWNKEQREFHYFAQELLMKYTRNLEKEDIELIEYMITHNSWWDTVDMIASRLVGSYFKLYPEEIKKIIPKWEKHENMWLRRSAILFQLKYREETNVKLLSRVIESNLGSKEFFINKAIGWALRTYSSFNPSWVLDFVADNLYLSNLSKKEATRLID